MRKIISSLSMLMIATTLSLAVGCNSGTNKEEGSIPDSVGNSPGANTLGDIGGDSAGVINTVPTNDSNVVKTDTSIKQK